MRKVRFYKGLQYFFCTYFEKELRILKNRFQTKTERTNTTLLGVLNCIKNRKRLNFIVFFILKKHSSQKN